MAVMTLEQLRIFVAVAEYLHFTRAAEVLYVTQPAVSAAIQNLEREYRVKLFHRIGRRIELTDAGKLLQLEAQKILEQVTLTERGLKELNDLQRGQIKLGSSLTIGNYWLPEKISQFHNTYPGISIHCTLANTEEICVGTATGQFDLALIEGEVKASLQNSIEQEIVGSDRLQIVVGKNHPWFNQKKIYLSELTQTDWVMREAGSGTQQQFEEALMSWGIHPSQLNVILILNTGEMVKSVLETGVAAAGISELMIQKELKLGTLRTISILDDRNGKIKTLEWVRPFLKLKHKERFQTRICSTFEEILSLNYQAHLLDV
ncbi:LysR family transcriptional regulator [Aphanothece hegewaldii CCALA 016]|uniref:LysR family transcriptional regulator n=1 Tax=Aphanothece hegewaldii CCALA 016 TaxID=2107694 RepID=A0A2T1M346_9CHRO|nr:LysR substrate-binding domain-containing protein [Aphanothece hegewaldii]PSF39252.1 LysR family transcriptional regulator [Aphanothece hegewaldii CCALA 016]